MCQTNAIAWWATSSVRHDSYSGTPQHIAIGLYLPIYRVNATIKYNNQIKTANEQVIAGTNTKCKPRINGMGEPLRTGLKKSFSHSSSWLAWTWYEANEHENKSAETKKKQREWTKIVFPKTTIVSCGCRTHSLQYSKFFLT